MTQGSSGAAKEQTPAQERKFSRLPPMRGLLEDPKGTKNPVQGGWEAGQEVSEEHEKTN